MPIDKRIPRVLNSDLDNKAIDKVSMLDALNLYSGPDNEGFSADGNKSDAGDQILKNIKGNVKVPEQEGFLGTPRLIGSVEDPKTDITYLFIHSTQAAGQGIWAYDRYGRLPGSQPNSLRLIYRSKQFNFPANGFVKADIVYTNAVQTFPDLGVDFDKDAIIYFTDGKNEPRKINAYRAFYAGHTIHDDDVYAEADFITACPKTPVKPITFSFGFDSSRSTSNFTTTPGFQFAYQYVYIDGMESAISPYSDVAFPPSVVFQGAQTFVNHNNYNVCNIRVPLPVPLASNEISTIKILAKQGTTGSFLIIDELEFGDPDVSNLIDIPNEQIVYPFYNDRIGTGISQNEVNKQFDSIPRKAVTQTVSSNRLMYGNYTDGFDAVKTKCEATVFYKESPESFLSYDVKITPSIEPIGGSGPANLGKSVGFMLDFSEMPSELAEGVELSLSVTMAPDRNWHAYTFKNLNGVAASFHQTRQLGPQTQEAIDNGYNNVNFQQSLAETDLEAGVEWVQDNYQSIFGNGDGVAPSNQSWNTVDTTDESNTPLGVSGVTAYGTSAANPIILKGGAVTFFAKIKTTQEISSNPQGASTQQKINQAFKKALLNQGNEQGFEVLEVQSTDSYNFDVGLYSGKRIKQDQIRASVSNTDSEARLICAVKTYSQFPPPPPGGFFIINKANVEMELKEVDYSNYPFVSSTSNHFRLKLKSINAAEIYTCLHATVSDSEELHPLDWIAISKEDLINIENSSLSIEGWLGSKGFNPGLKFHQNPQLDGEATLQTTAKQIGYLKVSSAFDLSEEVCLMDGEGGPGGGPSNTAGSSVNSYDYWKLYNQGSVTVNPALIGSVYGYGGCTFYTGRMGSFSIPNSNLSTTPSGTTLPMLFRLQPTAEGEVYSYVLPAPQDDNVDVINGAYPNFKRLQSPVEIVSNSFTISNLDDLESRSFKTEANHDFGIVYYDERGRHGFVNPLKTVFVEGYTDAERQQGGKGRVEIRLTLQHSPPQWAHQYKIVYSKNTTVQDFVQYSAGGGYISQNLDDQEISEANQNIYVSLNYLQGHPVSYVSSFGARTPEGGLNFYKFQEGDKLRVISYFEGEERKYVDVEFDVVELVKLGNDDNPLHDTPAPDYLHGDFVVLKNNPTAFGFSYGETLAGTAKWGNNCIIELRTPLKDVDADQRVFYEMSETYDVVIGADQNLVHDQEVLTLKNGDVWFRPVATNVREYENGEYVDIIFDTDDSADPPPQPNFKNVFLETSTATDLFRGDNLGLGRPNFVLKNAKETVREATITYSEPSNPEGKRLNYSSFNASLANFKDLPERFGGIQYMSDYDEFLFVLQEDKVSVVPVNKNILSDASGSNMVIASTEILGKAVFYSGQNGCDDDPSSVFDSGQEAYFCNKTLSKVYRWTKQGGVEEISDAGMSSVIRASIQRAINESGEVRIVGGYDPLKEEYLFTILKPAPRSTPSQIQYVTQPNQVIQPDGGTGEEDGDDPVDVAESPDISVSPDSIDFGTVESDAESPSISIEVFNDGNADLHVTNVTFTNSVFTLRGQTEFYVDQNQSKTIEVVFDASQVVGDVSATMTIENNDTNLDIPISATVEVAPPEQTLSEFQQAWNDFYLNYSGIIPTQYPLTSDDQMSADLAIQYLIDLKEGADESQHPTIANIGDLLSNIGSNTFPSVINQAVQAGGSTQEILSVIGDVNNDGDLNVQDLTSWLEQFSDGVAPADSSFFASFVPVPDGGGETSEGDEDGGGTDPYVLGLFDSPQSAVDYILYKGDMTAQQFHFLASHLTPGLRFDFNEDGGVGTADLLIFFESFDVDYDLQSSAFNPDAPLVGSGSPFLQQTTDEAIQYLILEGNMTVANYRYLASQVKNMVKSDWNGNGNVGTADQLRLLTFFGDASFSPDDLALQQ